MLCNILTAAVIDIVGRSPASLLADLAGVSHMTIRRKGWGALIERQAEVERRRQVFLEESLRTAGAKEGFVGSAISSEPSGAVARILYWQGLLDHECTPSFRQLVESFDVSDAKMAQALDSRDMDLIRSQFGAGSALGGKYFTPMSVSGVDLNIQQLNNPQEFEAAKFLRLVHMALSLLAAIDHEIGRWTVRQVGVDHWSGHSRFGVLLMPGSKQDRVRQPSNEPFARLVDFMGALGYLHENLKWPPERLRLQELGARAELSQAISGDGVTFIRHLRSGKSKMNLHNFRQLVRSQCHAGIKSMKASNPHRLGDLIIPYLLAAHVFTRLISSLSGGAGKLDLSGWREAYMAWWHHHAGAETRPPGPARLQPPPWLTEGQSSSSESQSSGRSSSPRDCQ
jgi:hypothetical protein